MVSAQRLCFVIVFQTGGAFTEGFYKCSQALVHTACKCTQAALAVLFLVGSGSGFSDVG